MVPPRRMGMRHRGMTGGNILIRELPRGPFGSYLRTHYQGEKPTGFSHFAMGCGAIFMLQHVRPVEQSFAPAGLIAETDPVLLNEMLALVIAQGLDVLSLAELRRRLEERDLQRRFVAFTFDGAYRSIIERVYPLFKKRSLPFCVYVGTDFLASRQLPWWIALETLIREIERVSLTVQDKSYKMTCRTKDEKASAYAALFRALQKMPSGERSAFLHDECTHHKIDLEMIARQEMLTGEELKQLAGDELVTIGSRAGGIFSLGELDYDGAIENVSQSLEMMEAAIGARPKHFAFPNRHSGNISKRDVKIIGDLGFDTAVTAMEGALWPEHAQELLALPRIALDNDPATLIRALMLSGGTVLASERQALDKASA